MGSDAVVSLEDLESTTYDHGGARFERKQIGAAAGSADLGVSHYEVPPEATTWPRHYHEGNEEAIFVLDGTGTIRLGPEATEHAIEAGDYVALPAGEQSAHAVRAGEDGLTYLAMSTMREPDVTVYPDSNSVGVFAGAAPGGDGDERSLSTYLDLDADVDYWED